MFCFRKNYFVWTVILLAAEIMIAVFVRDSFIRPHGGDILVVMLVYCFLRTFFRTKVLPAAIITLAIAFAAEAGQYFHLTRLLGIENNEIASGFFGNSFDWGDLVCYLCGVVLLLLMEYFVGKNGRSSSKTSAYH